MSTDRHAQALADMDLVVGGTLAEAERGGWMEVVREDSTEDPDWHQWICKINGVAIIVEVHFV